MPLATGFFLSVEGHIFLVTNRHVVTARNFFDPRIQLFNGATPGSINFQLFLYKQKEAGVLAYKDEILCFDLPDSLDEFFAEQSVGSEMDFAFFHIGTEDDIKADHDGWCIMTLSASTFTPEVMDSVFIAGFPDTGIFNETGFCIFKSGSVASEPDISFRGGAVLLDANTKSGMSGSPVLHRPRNMLAGHAGVVGVYSGRDENGAVTGNSELGVMWPIRQIVASIKSQVSRKREE